MAAQLMEAARTQLGETLTSALSRGDYALLRDWLREHIWRHGRRYTRDELLIAATGRPLDPRPYLEYLTAKYGDLGGLAKTGLQQNAKL